MQTTDEDVVNRQISIGLDVWSLVLGLVFGFGVNLLTAAPERWWPPLRLVNRYAPWWVGFGVVFVVGWKVLLDHRQRRMVSWRRTDSPYPGLEPFTTDRAAVFFGRDEETRQLLDRLRRSGVDPARRFVPLVGPSGSGKSSLLQAGILPRLGARWAVLGPTRSWRWPQRWH